MKLHVAHVGLCLCVLAGWSASARAATLNVDDDNKTGTEDGSAAHPFSTVQKAADQAAASGDTIQIAAGTYPGGTKVERKEVKLLGGFAGGTTAAYAAGTPGDFGTRKPTVNVTRLTGSPTVAALEMSYTRNSLVDGLVLSGGRNGLVTFGETATGNEPSNPTISNNLIENNGFPDASGKYPPGAGLYASKGGATITSNVIRDNTGDRGAGLASFCEKLVASGNVLEHNIGHADHAGGFYIAGADVTFTHNVVRGNESAGLGGGGLIFQDGNKPPGATKALMAYNVYTDNLAASTGSAFFVDDGAQATFDHELVYKNRCSTAHGEAIYVDGYGPTGTTVRITNSSIVDNPCPPVNPAVDASVFRIEHASKVTVENSIIWGNGKDAVVLDNSSLSVRYSITEQAHPGTGNLVADPLLASPASADYHLRSTVGRFQAGNWVTDAVSSPAIDAADPAAPFDLEPGPNGGRANMGNYGNTCEASMGGPGGRPATGDCKDAQPPPFSDAGPPPNRIDAGPVTADDGGLVNPGDGASGGCGCRAASRGHRTTPAAVLWLLAGFSLAGGRLRRRR
jgi:hypothetical protein